MNTTKNTPTIGIVICDIINNRQFVASTYVHAILCAKGFPILIPMTHSHVFLDKYISLCDGFLFCGGGDINPLLFGEEPIATSSPNSNQSTMAFDYFQIRLMQKALSAHKPIFAICRGMQVLNIALGGNVFQDLSLYPKKALNHTQSCDCRSDMCHKLKVKTKSLLYRITLHSNLYTNSFHHQAVHRLGKGLIVSAKSLDGIIEAIELPNEQFVLGVQWHPECLTKKSGPMRMLFIEFIHFSRITKEE